MSCSKSASMIYPVQGAEKRAEVKESMAWWAHDVLPYTRSILRKGAPPVRQWLAPYFSLFCAAETMALTIPMSPIDELSVTRNVMSPVEHHHTPWSPWCSQCIFSCNGSLDSKHLSGFSVWQTFLEVLLCSPILNGALILVRCCSCVFISRCHRYRHIALRCPHYCQIVLQLWCTVRMAAWPCTSETFLSFLTAALATVFFVLGVQAICNLRQTRLQPVGMELTGFFSFNQTAGNVEISYDIRGLADGEHGVHVHTYGTEQHALRFVHVQRDIMCGSCSVRECP